MALAHAGLGEHDAALACFDHARGLVQQRNDERLLAQVELQCAAMHVRNREFDRARRVCDAAHRIYVALDDRAGLTACDRLYGQVYRENGRYDLAALHLDLAARTAERESDALLAAGIEHDHATLHLERGDARGAIARLNRAHALCVAVAPYGEQAGVDILLQRIDASYVRVLEQWASDLLGPRDAYTLDHCRRVAEHAVRLGRALGLRDRALTWLHIGAFLHDIGKAVVPCSILEKPAALDGEERRLMERHALIGAQIVAALELPFDLAPVVRHHHERWDGSGYPDGLAAEAIPLHARIVAVADVHDAITSTRIYSMPCDAETAAGILESASGRGLDPALVSAFHETNRASVH
jgi:putative nucleotidyltransferase with HDIG domain